MKIVITTFDKIVFKCSLKKCKKVDWTKESFLYSFALDVAPGNRTDKTSNIERYVKTEL